MAKNTKDIVTPEIVHKPMGRPRIYDADEINIWMTEYIDSHEQPFLQEFSLLYDIDEDTVDKYCKENNDLFGTKKKLLRKQELYMLQNGSTGKINPVFTIFRLKQKCFGYTDKSEIDIKPVAPDLDKGQLQATLLEMLDDLPPDQRQKLLSNGDN